MHLNWSFAFYKVMLSVIRMIDKLTQLLIYLDRHLY